MVDRRALALMNARIIAPTLDRTLFVVQQNCLKIRDETSLRIFFLKGGITINFPYTADFSEAWKGWAEKSKNHWKNKIFFVFNSKKVMTWILATMAQGHGRDGLDVDC